MGIRDRPISPGSPWQNGYAERLIGTLRRECLDQMLIFGEPHLRRILSAYVAYYNQARIHLALQKMRPCTEQSNDLAPLSQFRSWLGCITNTPGYDFRKGQDITEPFQYPYLSRYDALPKSGDEHETVRVHYASLRHGAGKPSNKRKKLRGGHDEKK